MPRTVNDLPAILGGVPVRPAGPPSWPFADPEVRAALEQASVSDAWGQYRGPNVEAVELEVAAFQELATPALTCASGTLAVEIALRTLGVGPGCDVVLAAYEFESNFLTVHALGARPVLAEVAPHHWNATAESLERALTPNTKAILCSHLHGGFVPMREVRELAASRGIALVEDAAQATGAMVQGRRAGSWGDVGTLSFGGSKLLTAGRGGALVFRDERLRQRAKLLLSRGIQAWAPLSELQAIVLRPQLRRLESANAHRLANVIRLRELLHDLGVEGLTLFTNPIDASSPAYYKLGFQFEPTIFGLPRELFVKALRAEGIAFDAGFRALHVNRSPSRFVANEGLMEASRAHDGCVILHHPVLSLGDAEVDEVATAIAKVYRNRERFPKT